MIFFIVIGLFSIFICGVVLLYVLNEWIKNRKNE